MTVIDVHTHMLTREWIELLKRHGGPKYSVRLTPGQQDAVHLYDAPFMTLFSGMWDYEMRIKRMDEARVDVAIVSLTCPSVYWGGREISLAAAKMVNDSMAEQQRLHPDRIRWFASLPWQYAEDATAELARAVKGGAVGVFVTGNIDGDELTDAKFAPIWREIDRLGLPVLVHPTVPPGAGEMRLDAFNMVPAVGFMFDTTLALTRMILSGFLDTYPNVKLIVAHGGATLPYIAGRLDRCHEKIPGMSSVIRDKPSTYLQRLWYDTVVYEPNALEMCIAAAGTPDRVLYGSDYPHNIGDMVGCLARVEALPPDQAKRIAGSNAEKLFRL